MAIQDFHRYEFTSFSLIFTTFCNIHAPNISLGIYVAYFSSIAELAISASRDPPKDTFYLLVVGAVTKA